MTKEEKKKLNTENLRKLSGVFSYVWPYKWAFIAGLVMLALSSSIFMVFPYVAGKLLDIASGDNSWFIEDIGTAALVLLAILFVQSLVSFFRVLLFAQVTEHAMANIRTDLYHRMITLPLTFFDKNRTGELISRISNDVSILQDTLSVTLAELIRQFIILIVGVGLIFYVTPALSVFMLATFPVIVVLAMIFGKFIRKLSKKTQDQLAAANVIVDETIQSINSVKSFTSELFEIMRYRKSMKEVVNTALRVAKYRAAFISFIIFMLFGGIVAVMWYGATLVQAGDMSVGDLLTFVLYTTFIGASIAGIGDLFGQVQKAIGASERIMEIQAETPEQGLTDLSAEPQIKGDIVFDTVTFSYPTRREVAVLNGISLEVKEGQKIALVGHSGAGKSTMIQLLMRFYEVSGGKIFIGDKNIDQIGLQTLRGHIGIVPQEVILFGGSIGENILYGRPEASEEEVRLAAGKANALEFIDTFPEGMNTLVGERGVKLSGGQRQRIAIARVVSKDPSILILDEATSSLDAESEHLVQQALQELMLGRTTIIIAHRLATIRKVDKIYVLEKGKIVQSGSHTELMEDKDGTYKNFVDLQLLQD